MAITIQCSCGATSEVSDGLRGHHVSCLQCGKAVLAGAAAKGAGKRAGKAAGKPKQQTQRPQGQGVSLQISPGMLTLVGVCTLFATVCLVFKFGPARVANQWEVLGPKAEGQVIDVISFAAQAYLSEQGAYNPRKPQGRPSVEDGGVFFVRSYWVMSMPQKLRFFGVTQQGQFNGIYDTGTGEIEADIAYGGRTVAGLMVTNRATGVFHITGRDVNGSPQAEVDGEPLKIVYPPDVGP